jgi:hypothetical protein
MLCVAAFTLLGSQSSSASAALIEKRSRRSGRSDRACYKFLMPKIIERWLLFKYIGGELTPLSKPLKTKARAEKARQKYPERERKQIGIGVIRTKG